MLIIDPIMFVESFTHSQEKKGGGRRRLPCDFYNNDIQRSPEIDNKKKLTFLKSVQNQHVITYFRA